MELMWYSAYMACNIYFVLVDRKLSSLPTGEIIKDLMLKQYFFVKRAQPSGRGILRCTSAAANRSLKPEKPHQNDHYQVPPLFS
jgi:hypothetical protein